MEKAGKRLAVLVGCNYANTPNELHGCINDVLAMREMLITRFSFEPGNIKLLTDAPGAPVMPTGENIKEFLHRMVNQAEPGDVLYFHYSGHGTRVPLARQGDHFHPHEAIVPCDFNLITDVDFRKLVDQLPKGAVFTILSDSCHSGGLIDEEKEQIGPSSLTPNTTSTTTTSAANVAKSKTIPLETIIHHLTSLTGLNTSDIGTNLVHLFGAKASLSFTLPRHEQDTICSLHIDNGILLSGCQANETCADMNPHKANEKAYGAFSNAVQTVLKEHKGDLISNRQLVSLATIILGKQGFKQHPCLYSSDQNADATFLSRLEN